MSTPDDAFDYIAWTRQQLAVSELQGQLRAAWEVHGEDSPEAAVISGQVAALTDQSTWPQSWRRFTEEAMTDPEHHAEHSRASHQAYTTAISASRARPPRRATFEQLRQARRSASGSTPPEPAVSQRILTAKHSAGRRR